MAVSELGKLRKAFEAYASAFDPAVITATDATSVVEDAAAIENVTATLKSLAAARESESGQWRRRGARSPAHDLARRTGTSVGAAAQALEAAGRLGELAVLAGAAKRGEVSPRQVAAIAEAAGADPAAEPRLVGLAKHSSLGELNDECARVKAAARPLGAEQAHAEVHRSRFLRTFTDRTGGWNLTVRNVPEIGAELMAMLRPLQDRIFRQARAEGRRESFEAFGADALAEMVRLAPPAGDAPPVAEGPVGPMSEEDQGAEAGISEPSAAGAAGAAGATLFPAEGGPPDMEPLRGKPPSPARRPVPAKIIVRIDWDALVRGYPISGEVCEIPGIGPVPVAVVQSMIDTGDPFLAAVVTKGVDVANVAHLGRRATAHQVTALEWRDPVCPVLGCNAMANLEIDHREDWAKTRVTLLAWLDRPCDHHHDKKTREGWAFVPGVGKRPTVPPDDPRHPKNRLGTGAPRSETPAIESDGAGAAGPPGGDGPDGRPGPSKAA